MTEASLGPISGAKATRATAGGAVLTFLVLGMGAPVLWFVASIDEAYMPGGSGVTLPVLYALWPATAILISYLAWRSPRSSALRGAVIGIVISMVLIACGALFLFSRR